MELPIGFASISCVGHWLNSTSSWLSKEQLTTVIMVYVSDAPNKHCNALKSVVKKLTTLSLLKVLKRSKQRVFKNCSLTCERNELNNFKD